LVTLVVAEPLLFPQVVFVPELAKVMLQVFAQAGIPESEVKVTTFTELSFTRIGKVPGGVAVAKLEYVVQVVTCTPGQFIGLHWPKKQELQSKDVAELCQV
jgi:hypothetical protein